MHKVIILFLSGALFFANCKKKDTSKAYTPSCDGSVKSYSVNVKPLMQSYCVSCHGSYSTYSGVKGSASSIRSSIVGGSMPKGGSISDDQKNTIVCWIDAGMPNN